MSSYRLWLVLSLLATLPAAGQERRPIELKDYYAIETVSNPAISPDGKQVALVRTRIIEAENRSHSEIWLAPADRYNAARRLTHPSFSSTAPRWSPDGKLLAFTSRRKPAGAEEDATVWFLRMDEPGGEAFQIPGVAGTPIFSPDNQWIAFTKRTPPEGKRPTRELSDFEKLTERRFKGRIYDWMNARMDGQGYLPDRRDPYASPPNELYVVARQGGVARQITKLGVSVRAAAWSPDSRRLAIIADSHERDEYTYERADLWVVDQAGGEGGIRRLTDDGYEYSSPAWSADGRSLVFLRSQSLNQVIASKQNHGAKIDIYRMPAGGGEMENLTAPFDLIPAAPASNPDGRSIYFTAAVGGDAQLFRMPAAGGKAEPVQSGGRLVRRGFSLSAAMDRMAYVEGDSTDPGNVYSARTDGTAGLRLTDVNDELLARLTLNQARGIHYRSDDGTEIEGWVVFPRSYDPLKGKYPLILNIHGGPHGAFSSGFSFETQLLAARGYIVVFTNPRGSTGYGEKFLWGTWGGWGVLDYQDVMAGVRFVEQGFAVDPKRMGVGGYSYGGFLTNWIITQTDRFAAAVTGAGISNWVSDYGTADIPRTKESEFFGAPWDPRGGELLRKYSPITYVNKARTPTLFVHGESDMRVPIEEAEQMYTALKKQHVQAKMVRYPDTYHGGWTPWNTVHRYWQELQWWDEHLMPGK